ncbi:MAG: hypothetical protein RLZ05_1240 [Bacteroidota bacterium]|jgi:threonine/homoserine/homoserine lactone efflux protein
MMEDFQNARKKEQSRFAAWRDIGMGLLIILVGVFFFGRGWVVLDLNNRYPPDDLDKWFGAVCFLYGGWRLVRGYKANRIS